MAMSKYGYEVILFTAGNELSKDEIGGLFKHITTGQLDVYQETNLICALIRGLWNFRASKVFIKTLEDTSKEVDTIIHLYGWTKALSSSIVRTAVRSNIPVVCSLFDYLIACPNGAFYNFKKKSNCTLKPLSFACAIQNCDSRSYAHKLWRLLRHFIQKYVGKIPGGVDQYIGCSNLSVSILKPFLPEKSTITFIRNPISIPRSSPVDVDKNDVFIFVGRLSAEKGPLLFAEAAKILGIKAIFIGDGDLRKTLETSYPDFILTGWISHEKISNYMKSARALVFPSVWTEVQGLVVLEAASMGVPAIVPNLAATREMVTPELTGLWFESGDLRDLVKQISKLQNGEFSSLLGINAYNKFWDDPPTIDKHMDQLNSLYRSIFSKKSLKKILK